MEQLIGPDVAIAAMEKAVAAKGEDYVYRRPDLACLYADPETGEPSCIVGYVLAELKPEVFEALAAAERSLRSENPGRSVSIGYTPHELSRALGGWSSPFERAVDRALGAAQVAQDREVDWGYVLDAFKGSLGRS